MLVLGGAVLLSSYIYLSASAGRVLKPLEFARFSYTIMKSLTHPSEGGASRALSLSKEALRLGPSSGSIEVDGKSFAFPLPKYAVPQQQSAGRFSFLAFVSPDEMQNYFDRDLPQAGWTQVEQIGAAHVLQGHGVHMRIVQHFYLTSDISEFDVFLVDRR